MDEINYEITHKGKTTKTDHVSTACNALNTLVTQFGEGVLKEVQVYRNKIQITPQQLRRECKQTKGMYL